VSSHSLQFQNVTDHAEPQMENKAESNLWHLRENQLGGSLYLNIMGGGPGLEQDMEGCDVFNSQRLSQSLPRLNGSIPQTTEMVNWKSWNKNGRPRYRTNKSHLTADLISAYICPVLVSFLAISTTLVVTLSILHWNYVENNQRKISKKMIILNHWGKGKPVEADLEKIYLEDLEDLESLKETEPNEEQTGDENPSNGPKIK